MSSNTVFIIAGEASGDIHGANLVREMKYLKPDLHFFGIGGDKMKEEGVELFYHINQMSLVGVVEVIKHIPFVYKVINRIISLAKKKNPQLVILIDYPGFNIRLGKGLKKLGKKIFYYISPQVWAWGKKRIKKIAEFTDKMAVILPFEEEIYRNAGIDASFIGNPVLDVAKTDVTREEFFKKCRLSNNKITIGLLPGSRVQEVTKLLPLMQQALKILIKRMNNIQGIVSKSSMIEKEIYEENIDDDFPIPMIENYNYPIMKYSDILVVASGTATIEAAVFETPLIIAYKVSPLTYFLARLFVKVPYIGLVNIIAGEKIVHEIIQRKTPAQDIACEMEKIIKNPELMTNMRKNLKKVKNLLGTPGASKRAAAMALELIN